jgi:CubicO group peptidase (beta-lactamase class C family)
MYKHLIFICLIALSPNFIQAQSGISNKSTLNFHAASYKNPVPGKFLRRWLIAGPVKMNPDSTSKPSTELQQKFFTAEHVSFRSGSDVIIPSSSDGDNLKWSFYESANDQVVFDTIFKGVDFAAAFAAAEIMSDRERSLILSLGSDDAVKVYFNGQLVHKNWIARAANADDDIVQLKLRKGRNVLVLEVQDIEGGWAFIARFADKSTLAEKLTTAAGAGNLEEVRTLMNAGADLNAVNKHGVAPLQAAHIAGRKGVAKYLADKGAKPGPIPSATEIIDSWYANLTREMRPGIAILVAKNGKILYNKGFGYADIAGKKKIMPATRFRIGSITKQFTAASLLKLQEQGKLKISDKLSKYIPDFPRGNEVTLHHLLTHTSGIHSYTNTDSFLSKVTTKVSDEDLVSYIKKLPYDFNPGERYDYNNSGYFLAGFIVQQVSGIPFRDFLKQHFFDPLGMANTGVHSSGLNLENEATGYNKTDKYDTALNWDMSWAGGAGALYSTVEDLYKWNEAIFGNKVLSKESLTTAFSPVLLNSGKVPAGIEYGYGWGIGKFRGTEILSHGGGLHGFVSQLARFNKEGLTVAMLTNQTPVEVELNPARVAELYLWQKLDTQETYDASQQVQVNVKDYEGIYDLGNNIVMTVTSEGSSLFAQVAGQGKYEIFPMRKDEYFWKVVEAKVRFNRNESGEVNGASFEQGGFKATAERKPL